MKEHYKGCSSVFPVILRGKGERQEVLLHLRKNTTTWSGYWDFCGSGHIEAAETATQAVARECLEEVGIVVKPEDARFVHVMHSVWEPYDPSYCDFYFVVERYEGTPYPAEPDKCADMRWWPVNALPDGMIPLRRTALERILQGMMYSEHQVLRVRTLAQEEITPELLGDLPASAENLHQVIQAGGVVCGAFMEGVFQGYAAVRADAQCEVRVAPGAEAVERVLLQRASEWVENQTN